MKDPLLYLFIGLELLCLLGFIRNIWIASFRFKILDRDCIAYKKLPSYTYMMFDFTVWNFNKYLEENK